MLRSVPVTMHLPLAIAVEYRVLNGIPSLELLFSLSVADLLVFLSIMRLNKKFDVVR